MPERTEETGFEEARRRIAACAEARGDTLDLSGLMLVRLPEELCELTWLRRLKLRDNRIGAVGAGALAALTGLTSLNLPYNNIGDDGARALATSPVSPASTSPTTRSATTAPARSEPSPC